jgi:DNA polymerase-3 subunit beta
MKISTTRDQLLKPLTYIGSVVERRQTLPILANAHLRLDGDTLTLTGTDLEVEVIAVARGVAGQAGETTVAARKLLDICRALPDGADLLLAEEGERATIQSGRSRFTLQTLPPGDFPRIETEAWDQELALPQGELKALLDRTAFSMAQQDVRYYLNGLLLELTGRTLRAVATDGHRLAKSELNLAEPVAQNRQIIVPRKAVMELARLLSDSEEPIQILINPNHLRVAMGDFTFTSKLIDGRYPDYEKVIPAGTTVSLSLPHKDFHDTLSRAAILTNDKFRGVRLNIANGTLAATAHNPEQEEASDEMAVEYDGEELEIGFNVTYLMEAVNALAGDVVEFSVKDQNSSCVLRRPGDQSTLYLVMPMRL